MRLGRRQLDVLRAAAEGRSWTHHSGHGRMTIVGLDGVHPDEVLERLLELDLIRLGECRVAGHVVQLSDAGRALLLELDA